MTATPPAPRGARAAGKRLWLWLTTEFELSEPELALLRQAVRYIDELDLLHGVVERDGPLLLDRFGEPRVHPALVEARQSRLALARILTALRVPDSEDRRPQRRGGVRGFYTLPRGGRETA